MYKIIILTKRKPGTSLEEFRNYYETHHVPLAKKFSPLLRRYTRNYLLPVVNDMTATGEPPFDCVTEGWFDSEEDCRKTMEAFASDPEIGSTIARDEENFMDRSKIWWFTSMQCESTLP